MRQHLILTHYTTVNACGQGLAETAEALRAGRSGLAPCNFDDADLDTHIGRVRDLESAPLIPALADYECRNNRLAQMTLRADGFEDAVRDAAARYGPDRIAVIMGSSTSGVGEGEKAYRARAAGEEALPEGFDYDRTHDFYSLPRFVSNYLHLDGPNTTISAACASSSKTFADAWQWIEAGICDAAVVGGVDSLCLMTLRGFNSLELLSRGPCRPNDANRSGISIAEAGGFALIERVEVPEPGSIALLGYGESSDAYHMSAPDPEGRGASLAMESALARAGLAPEDVDYVNLHGTGSNANDLVEDSAVNRIFGDRVPVSSTKGWTGHPLGAAGITEAVISVLCLRDGFVPENLNLETRDPKIRCAVTEHRLEQPVRRVLSNSFGFGGSNCSIVLGRVA